MWMSKAGRAFVGLIALATMMLTVAPMSAGAKPPRNEQTVTVTMAILDDGPGLQTDSQCGGPLIMVQSTKRLRVDWPQGDEMGKPGVLMDLSDWGLSGCHGATNIVPEGMAGGLLILNETPGGVELISRFDYVWECTTTRGRKTSCSAQSLYELTGLFPALDLSLMDENQDVTGMLRLQRFDRDMGWEWEEDPATIAVELRFHLTTP